MEFTEFYTKSPQLQLSSVLRGRMPMNCMLVLFD